MRRLYLALLIAITAISFSIAPVAAHGCHPGRSNSSYIEINNNFSQTANSGVYFRDIRGEIEADNALHVVDTPTYVYLQAGTTVHARVGWRIDPDGSIHKFFKLMDAQGNQVNQIHFTNINQTLNDVDGTTLRIEVRYNLTGGVSSYRFWWGGDSYNVPFTYSWQGWEPDYYSWVFGTRDHASQFFGHLSTANKWGVMSSRYTTQYGQASSSLGYWKNHYYSWARGYTYQFGGDGNYDSARVYDDYC